jgi:signal transduction histidine kinase/CheY-like chemotaxis protein/ligand-binding sensor domain-containing protein
MIKKLLVSLLTIFFAQQVRVSGQQKISVSLLTSVNGLSQNTINCLFEDRYGFLWFGTQDGLNKYDGYKITVYKHILNDSSSLPANHITAIGEDAQGNLWVGTRTAGIGRLNRSNDTFTNYKHDARRLTSISDNSINCIYKDSSSQLWIGTDKGLNRFNAKTGSFTCYRGLPRKPNTLSSNVIYSVFEDDDHRFWIGTDSGIDLLNRSTGQVIRYPDKAGKGTGNMIYTICEDARHQIWLGTDKGLKCFSPRNASFAYYAVDPDNNSADGVNPVFCIQAINNNKFWLGTNTTLQLFDAEKRHLIALKNKTVEDNLMPNDGIYSMFADPNGILWIGTTSQGVLKYDKNLSVFPALKTSLTHIPSAKNIIRGIAEDKKHNLYLATDAGLNYYNRVTNSYKEYVHQRTNSNSLLSNYTTTVLVSRNDGMVWIGSFNSGLDRLDPRSGNFKHYHYTAGKQSDGLGGNAIDALLEDHVGNIWIASDGGGVDVLDPATGKMKKYRATANGNGICDNTIDVFYEDKKGRIWMGGYTNGISIYDPSNQHFTQINSHNSGLNCDVISAFYEDSEGHMWIGTMEGGLNCYDERTQKFTAFTEQTGLLNNTINYITGDQAGYIWITTNQGISRLDPKHKAFRNFNLFNGLRTLEFCLGAGARLTSGELVFGSINGFNIIDPANLAFNNNKPPVVFTGLELFNKPVSQADYGSPLHKSMLMTREISLNYDQSVFSVNFAALDYSIPTQNNYAYQLEGFDKDWRYVGNQHRATYTNLSPGTYRFKVKASNNDGLWSAKAASLVIVVQPPYWMTWWFRGLIISLAILLIYIGYYYRVRFLNRQKAELELQVKQRTQQLQTQSEELQAQSEELQVQSEELMSQTRDLELLNQRLEEQKAQEALARQEADKANKAKSTFLATMSHEIRTPMNGVLGMASLLAETKLNHEQQEYTDAILNSGESLLNVINDVLDFSKIESGNMELDPHHFDLCKCLEDVLELFAAKTAQHGVDLLYQIADDVPAYLYTDSFRLKQILMNMVGNAVKFTQQGEIFIGVKIEECLPDETLLLCFEVRDTGIGIPQDQVDRLFTAFNQLDSSITRKYGGSGLGLAICDRLIHLMGGQVAVKSQPGQGSAFSFTIKCLPGHDASEPNTRHNVNFSGKKVLLVDDNPTNLLILQTQLSKQRMVTQATHSGQAALDVLVAGERFDLLITDMQMPDMDGVTLSVRIKELCPELPVILLSSIGDETKKQHPGLFFEVLTKPIRQQALFDVITAALEQQEKPEMPVKKSLLTEEFAVNYPFNILVAEDNLMNQKLIMRVLNKLGYQPELASDGEEVLEKMAVEAFDLILMDVQMPKLDGLQTTRIIRQKYEQKPLILALTANALSEDRDNCLEAGMDGYLAKPLNLDQLIQTLTTLYQQNINNLDS